jgi:hypothetical protein
VLSGLVVAIGVAEYWEQVVNDSFMTCVGCQLPSEAYSWTTPWRISPLAVLAGLVGLALSVLIYPGRPAPALCPFATFRS